MPPEVILRMMLLLFLDDVKSERELMRIIPERLVAKIDQMTRPEGDPVRRSIVGRFQIIAAKHDDH